MRKDATITVRVTRSTRRRLEALAKREGRSLSQQIGRLLEAGLDRDEAEGPVAPREGASLAGLLAREPAPEYDALREVRTLLSASVARAGGGRGRARR